MPLWIHGAELAARRGAFRTSIRATAAGRLLVRLPGPGIDLQMSLASGPLSARWEGRPSSGWGGLRDWMKAFASFLCIPVVKTTLH